MRIFGLAFLVALTGAATPGPLLALVIGQALVQGLPATLLILAGHALIEAVFVVLLAAGLSAILARPRTRGVLAIGGGLVMAWMGVDILRHVGATSLAGTHGTAMPWFSLVAAGAGVSVSNPYFTGWWATVGTGQVAALGLRSRVAYLLFLAGHELGDLAWYLAVTAALVFGRH